MLKQQTIVISGASSGLGKEIALLLKTETVILLSRTKPEILSPTHIWLPCDITSNANILEVCKKLPDAIDTFIHCSGVGLAKPFEETTHEEINTIVDTNVSGALHLTLEIYKKMVVQKSGHIITVVSTSGKKPRENEVLYCASKFAQAGLSESLHLEGLKHNVNVTTVYPGGMKTNFYNNMPSRNIDSFMDPKHVAKQIVALLHPEENCAVSSITIERMK